MKIYFDLDGTLLDASERLYRLFCDLVPECQFSKEEYWKFKRNKINHQMILDKYFQEYDFEKFNVMWLDLIEAKQYIVLDKLYDFSKSVLSNSGSDNYLLTARQSKKNLMEELEKVEIRHFFKEIYVTENKVSKLDILNSLDIKPNDIFISDMGQDVKTGHLAMMKTVAVSWGFMSAEKLSEYQPDFLINRPQELITLLNNQ